MNCAAGKGNCDPLMAFCMLVAPAEYVKALSKCWVEPTRGPRLRAARSGSARTRPGRNQAQTARISTETGSTSRGPQEQRRPAVRSPSTLRRSAPGPGYGGRGRLALSAPGAGGRSWVVGLAELGAGGGGAGWGSADQPHGPPTRPTSKPCWQWVVQRQGLNGKQRAQRPPCAGCLGAPPSASPWAPSPAPCAALPLPSPSPARSSACSRRFQFGGRPAECAGTVLTPGARPTPCQGEEGGCITL